MEIDPIVGAIEARRERLGVSQSELARLAGMSQPLVNAYLRGQKKPSTHQAARLLNAMGDWEIKFSRRARKA